MENYITISVIDGVEIKRRKNDKRLMGPAIAGILAKAAKERGQKEVYIK